MTQGNQYPDTRRAPAEPRDRRDTFAVGRAKPPPHLDKVARKLFKQLAAKLTTAGVFRDVDDFSVGELCQAQADVIRYTADIAKEGEMLTATETGNKYWNPKLGLLKDARRRVKEWSDRLGLSIKARAHLKFPAGAGAPNHPTQDEIEKFLNGELWNQPGPISAPIPFKTGTDDSSAAPSPAPAHQPQP